MSIGLFDKIHDFAYLCDRTSPATLEDFVEFGLQPEDYVHYVGLQLILQGELITYGHLKTSRQINESEPFYPTLEKFISFCREKRLINDIEHEKSYFLNLFERDDAEYYHGWLRYPKDSKDFRLAIERKLACFWDEEEAYITETFGLISFVYDDSEDGNHWIDPDSPLRIMKFNSETHDSVILNNNEVRKLFKLAQKEKLEIENEIEAQLAQMPSEHDPAAVTTGLPWIKKIYELCNRQDIIESVYDSIECATKVPDIYKFKESDTLFVFCGTDTCKEEGHLLSKMRVEFSFYNKPNKRYTIARCAHCMRFQITLQELTAMFESYGIPRAKIVYDDEIGSDFSNFDDTSIFYDMGYTVSQSVGLSAARRQAILEHAIEIGKASKKQVLDFLMRRMNINGMKSGNETAFKKWKDDYEYIRQL